MHQTTNDKRQTATSVVLVCLFIFLRFRTTDDIRTIELERSHTHTCTHRNLNGTKIMSNAYVMIVRCCWTSQHWPAKLSFRFCYVCLFFPRHTQRPKLAFGSKYGLQFSVVRPLSLQRHIAIRPLQWRLQRWWEICEKVPVDRFKPFAIRHSAYEL